MPIVVDEGADDRAGVGHLTRAKSVYTGWTLRPAVPPLPETREVHVWRTRVSHPEAPDWHAILSAKELERAERFHFAEDRRRFAVTRAVLRTILGKYLDLAPQSLGFSYNSFGKPSLDDSKNDRGMTFNVTHSGQYSLLAFGLTLDLGIDIEHLGIDRNFVELAKPLFSASEYRQFLAKPDAVRKRDFLQAWTRREAVGKALGVGISLTPGAYESAIADASEWSICNMEAADDYVAALAARAPIMHVRLWDCQS